MKQYAGNWASGTFSFRDKSMEDRINERIVKAADNQIDQLDPLFGNEISEIFIQKAVAFRMMHPMGRMHISALMRHTDWARRPDPTGGRVRQQRPHRLELRRRSLPRRAPDRGAAGAMPVRTGRRGRRVDRVAAGLHQEGAVPRDRRRARHGREGLVPQRRRLQRAAVAAQRPDPAHGHVDPARVRGAGRPHPGSGGRV